MSRPNRLLSKFKVLIFIAVLLLVTFSRSVQAQAPFQLSSAQETKAQIIQKKISKSIDRPTDSRKRPLEEVQYEDYQSHYTLNSDYTYTRITSTRIKLLTPLSLQNWQRARQSYYPDTQALEVLEAYVIQPDGSRINVASSDVFTRPSEESQSAPGFDSSLTTTVVFPQLQVGSQTYVKWKFTQKKPSLVGLHEIEMPVFRYPSRKETIVITMPSDLKVRWAKQGDYTTTDQVRGKQRIITAVLENYQERQPERSMPDVLDVSSFFIFSNLNRWEDLGATYWRQSQSRLTVTSEVKALADKITGNKTGLEAARALYNWVAQNIQYVAIYLNEDAGWVPHSVSEILKNGYGDCKDHVAVLQTLLQAKGIESVPALINSGYQYTIFPLPISAFDHVIIYLPQFQIFSDPTNSYAPFGELNTSLSNKFVVLATEKGSIAHTPASRSEQNRYSFNGMLIIAPDGTLTGQNQIQYKGQAGSDARRFFTSDTLEQLADQALSSTPEGGYGSFKTSDLNNLNQVVTAQGNWTSPHAVELGKQAYMTVPIGLDTYRLQSLRSYISYSERLYPLIVGAETLEWSYTIQLPEGYQVSRLPRDINFQNETGSYISRYQQKENNITVQRQLVINKDVYAAKDYSAFESLIYKPINDSRSVIVLKQN